MKLLYGENTFRFTLIRSEITAWERWGNIRKQISGFMTTELHIYDSTGMEYEERRGRLMSKNSVREDNLEDDSALEEGFGPLLTFVEIWPDDPKLQFPFIFQPHWTKRLGREMQTLGPLEQPTSKPQRASRTPRQILYLREASVGATDLDLASYAGVPETSHKSTGEGCAHISKVSGGRRYSTRRAGPSP